MTVVSDASPLIGLAAVGLLDLLQQLYGTVLIAEAVQREVLRPGESRAGEDELRLASWITIRPVENAVLVEALRAELGAGEAEAIALAVERRADLLLMDERRGRAAAVRMGLDVIGVVGVLIEAKQKGLIPLVSPALDRLREGTFRLGPQLHQRALEAAGE